MTFATLRHQPIKGIYLTYQLLSTVLVRLPVWILLSIRWRPRPSWDIKRTILVRGLRHFWDVSSE